MAKPKLWLGLAVSGVALLTLVLAGQKLADANAGLINDVLGLSTKKIDKIDSDEVEGSAYAEEDGSLSNNGWKKMIKDAYKFCEEAVEQGSVLFKNDNDALPLKADERNVTLFGQGSKNLFMRSGAGGAAPNDNLVVKLDAAFEANGFNINRAVFDKYSTVSGMTTPSTTVEHSFSGFYTDAMKETFAEYGDAAIVTFVRIGTENTDPPANKLDLNNDEAQLLRMIKEYKDNGTFKKVIVMINSPLPMSMDWANDSQYGVDSVIYMGVPGYYGAGGIVHVLMGQDAEGKVVNPSGHAVDTFAASASSSAAYQNFGNSQMVVYKENIYVGYKYYETRYEDLVLNQGNADSTKGVYKSSGAWNYAEEMGYPFGYGMSYTNFEQKITSLKYNSEKDTIDAEVEVKNVGELDGKASVQLYVQAPYTQHDKDNGLGKSAIALMTYEKADVKAGETVKVKLSFDRYFLTTYDYKINKTYILEGGTYYFAVGNGAHEALNNIISVKEPSVSLYDHNGDTYIGNELCVKTLEFEDDPLTYRKSHYNSDVDVENQFDDADYNYEGFNSSKKITYLDRQDWNATWPTTTQGSSENPAPSAQQDMSNYYKSAPADGPKYTDGDGEVYNVDLGDEKITFNEMAKVPLEGKVEDEESRFYNEDGAEVWDRFISQMNLDDLCISVSDNRGILAVKKVMKPGNSVAEGPEGLLSKYQYGDKRWATGFPTGPTYTGTWDHEMQAKFGAFYGEDALFCGVACVNAPGANINRTPYGSRASEYMSEDAILNYNTAANIVGAARKKGLIMNIKHCFLNNQESGRQGVATFCNEQALREIYLKPFEGALTKGHGLGIMTSYNRIGVRYAACHEPLMMNVMRGEWGYKGLIIDDALTGSNTSNYSNGPAMVHSGTDLFCLDGNRGSQLKSWVTGNNDGTILQDLQRANKYIMYAMSRSWMGGVTPMTEEELEQDLNPWWKKAVTGLVIGAGSIAAILVGVYAFFEIMNAKNSKAGGNDNNAEPASAE